MCKRETIFFVSGAVLVTLLLLIIFLLSNISSSTFFFLEGTDLAIEARDNADHSASVFFFHKDSDPSGSLNCVTITSDQWKSLIVVDPSNSDVVYVDPEISIESSSDISILHLSHWNPEGKDDALKYWYSSKEHTLWTGSFVSNYTYIINPAPSRLFSGKDKRHRGLPWTVIAILALALLSLCGWMHIRLSRNGRKSVRDINPIPMQSIPPDEDAVYIKGMERSVLSEALGSFEVECGIECFYSNVYAIGQYYVVTTKLDYDQFASFVNYMRHCDARKKYQVVGWLHIDEPKTSNQGDTICDDVLMFYFPESDAEYDNVYFVTRDNTHYKQEFGGNCGISGILSETRPYESRESFCGARERELF